MFGLKEEVGGQIGSSLEILFPVENGLWERLEARLSRFQKPNHLKDQIGMDIFRWNRKNGIK